MYIHSESESILNGNTTSFSTSHGLDGMDFLLRIDTVQNNALDSKNVLFQGIFGYLPALSWITILAPVNRRVVSSSLTWGAKEKVLIRATRIRKFSCVGDGAVRLTAPFPFTRSVVLRRSLPQIKRLTPLRSVLGICQWR